MGDNKLVITTELKTFHFNLPKDTGINLKHEIYSIIKHNELLAEHTLKNAENSKTHEPHKFLLNLPEARINMLLCKTYLCMTPENISGNSIKTLNSK